MRKRNSESFLIGFVVGGLAGAITALLTTPQSGEKTREQISESRAKFGNQLETKMADLQTQIDHISTSLLSQITAVRTKMAHMIEAPDSHHQTEFDSVKEQVEDIEEELVAKAE